MPRISIRFCHDPSVHALCLEAPSVPVDLSRLGNTVVSTSDHYPVTHQGRVDSLEYACL